MLRAPKRAWLPQHFAQKPSVKQFLFSCEIASFYTTALASPTRLYGASSLSYEAMVTLLPHDHCRLDRRELA
jgi:hypothetical protein